MTAFVFDFASSMRPSASTSRLSPASSGDAGKADVRVCDGASGDEKEETTAFTSGLASTTESGAAVGSIRVVETVERNDSVEGDVEEEEEEEEGEEKESSVIAASPCPPLFSAPRPSSFRSSTSPLGNGEQAEDTARWV